MGMDIDVVRRDFKAVYNDFPPAWRADVVYSGVHVDATRGLIDRRAELAALGYADQYELSVYLDSNDLPSIPKSFKDTVTVDGTVYLVLGAKGNPILRLDLGSQYSTEEL